MHQNVPENIVGHPFSQQDGHRIRFGSVGTAGVPNADEGPALEARKNRLYRRFQRLRIAKEKREGHRLLASCKNKKGTIEMLPSENEENEFDCAFN